ncbi:YitT family protein [Neobacillus novalis]|uniref:YitT family protein n=1 Tax=Neobacillus novalis TaxID=220687 RepID=A0AA95SAN6_9BACI|nr:YitT family protein [Neobacillus novalis]WHY85992.1 YitT family protein [Neobacillus novalis]
MENKGLIKKHTVDILKIIFGTAIMALNYYVFLKPNHILAPGLGGIAIIIAQFVPLSLGVTYFILNIPLFFSGFRFVGGRFVLYSLCGMFSLSIFLFLFDFLTGFHQQLIGSIVGGILNGAFLAMVLLVGGSTGGLDIAFVVINKFWPRFSIGNVMFVINAIVVIVSGLLFGFGSSIYTIISIYLAGKALDFCMRQKERSTANIDSLSS